MQSVADLLRGAKDLISDPIHWTKGDYARSEDGETIDASHPEAFRYCSLGAIYHQLWHHEEDEIPPLGQQAINVLASVIAEEYGYLIPSGSEGSCVASFNDAEETDHEKIMVVFNVAVLRAELKEGVKVEEPQVEARESVLV